MKKDTNILLFCILVLSACSICYEFILAQALTAFLGNTILRYTITIGLYLFSLGIGAWLVNERYCRNISFNIRFTEIFLGLIGGLSVIILYFIAYLVEINFIFSICAHMLIIVIGILTGFELPALMYIVSKDKKEYENVCIAFNAIGACLGTILFSFILYQRWGLLISSFILGITNFAIIFIFALIKDLKTRTNKVFLGISTLGVGVYVILLLNYHKIELYLFNLYIARG